MQIKDVTSKIGSGATPTGGDKSYKTTGISLIRSQNVLDMSFNRNGLAHIDEQQAQKLDGVTVHEEDVLLNITGDSIARCCIVPKDILPARVNQHVAIIRAKTISPKYLLYFLQYLKPHLMQICKVGGTRNALTKEVIEELPFWEVDNADKAIKVLSDIDELIQNNTVICSTLESMAKLLYHYWFVQFDFPDENGRPYKSSGGKTVWNEELKREIPEGWAATKLEEHIGLERGISYSTSDLQGEGIPMINLGSFAIGGGYKEENLKTYSGAYSDDKIITPYDLIICLTQQTSIDPNKDVIGCSMLVPDIFDVDIVISQDLTKVVCSEELKYYLAQYFNTSYFHRYITGFASGSNILHLDVNGILNNTAVIPPKNVLIKFEKIMKTMFEKRSECLIENQQLASLRDFLLPMLMNGQVKVGKAGD